MIGIYLITNKINGKIYVGQSNDIERRFKEHCSPTRYLMSHIPLEWAIHKYGKENFTLEILEECMVEELNEKETYWIRTLDAINQGYNCNEGGNIGVQGATNPNAKVTEEDVEYIRDMYAAHARKKEVYERVKNKITWSSFESIFEGRSWVHIKPEVLTEENKQYYATQSTNGENSTTAKFTNEEVIELRNKYITHTAKELYTEEYQKRIAYQGFQGILSGKTYKDLPFYSKKHGQWFYNGERPAPIGNRGKVNYRRGILADEEIIQYRTEYIDMTAKEVYAKHPEIHDAIGFGSFQKMLTGKLYPHLKHYSKKLQQWIE